MYYCTHIVKEVSVDDYEEGCETERVCTMDERCNIEADTVAELLQKIGAAYSLDIDDVFIPSEDDSAVDWLGFNRAENGEGDEPSEAETAKWRKGKAKLWLADYAFKVEYRETRPLTLDEIKGAGVLCH